MSASATQGGHNNTTKLEITWANAQREGRPAEYRRRPLFNAAKFASSPILKCRSVTLPRREILLLNTFFSDCRYML